MVLKNNIYRVIKRLVDIVIAIIGCIVLVPLTAIIYILYIISGDIGSIFFVQKRIGKDGKLFKMYKYRSMVVNADWKLKKYLLENPEVCKEFKKYKKLKNDPRITWGGRIIRKYSLDEFPQFINILKGEMSVVGPRPYLPREKRTMGDKYKEVIKVKPGLTGPWQVNGRSRVDFEERLKIDEEYVKKFPSLKLDIKIFLKTFSKLAQREGAT